MNNNQLLEMELKSNADNYSLYSDSQIEIILNQYNEDLKNIVFEITTINYLKAQRLVKQINDLTNIGEIE